MNSIDWTDIPESEHEAFLQRLALVETILDERIDDCERLRVREEYLQHNSITDRTIRNYLKRYREKGPEGLLFYKKAVPSPRVIDEKLRDHILLLINQRPTRTVPQVRRLLSSDPDYMDSVSTVSDRTLYRFLFEQGLTQKNRRHLAHDHCRKSYHQFEADASLHLVQGDARDGIYLPDPKGKGKMQRKTYLFGWVDDFSRKILFAKYYWDEKLPRMEDSFKNMILRWGIPKKIYLDNGSVYISRQFAWILKELGIKKIHHRPYQAWCKGKVEAVMKTIKNDFQSEASRAGFRTLEELNSALWAWIDVEYNERNHSSTGEAPSIRFQKGMTNDHRRVDDLKYFENLFLLRESRTVSKYGNIKLCGNEYHTDTAVFGTVVETRYEPFDLSVVYLFENGTLRETLKVRSMINKKAPHIPEEKNHTHEEISTDSALYFTRLRERHEELQKIESSIDYSKLTR